MSSSSAAPRVPDRVAGRTVTNVFQRQSPALAFAVRTASGRHGSVAGRARLWEASAPGDKAPIGGLKVITGCGSFACGPSPTENIYKSYAESFRDEAHLNALLNEALNF
jgi:phosphoglucomutase